MKLREIRELDSNSLKEKVFEVKSEIAKEKGMVASGTKPEKPGKIKQDRKVLARVLTILKERELGIVITKKAKKIVKEEIPKEKTKAKEVKPVKKVEKKKEAKKIVKSKNSGRKNKK
jgi:large subunit ribosomal protein L29